MSTDDAYQKPEGKIEEYSSYLFLAEHLLILLWAFCHSLINELLENKHVGQWAAAPKI